MQTHLWPIVQALDPVTIFNRYPGGMTKQKLLESYVHVHY